MKKQEAAHPSEPNDKQSELQSDLMTQVLRDMEALGLINLKEQSESTTRKRLHNPTLPVP